LIQINLSRIRVLVVTGALFLFMDCAGRVKSWKFHDTYSLEVRILDSEQWLEDEEARMLDLDKIMEREIRYYLDKDMRIYDRIEPNYEAMVSSLEKIDSVLKKITTIHELMKNTPGDSLDSVPQDSSLSYGNLVKSSSKDIELAKKVYFRALKKLKKGFRKDRKKLVFIQNEYADYKKTLYDIKYKREELQPDLNRFKKKLNQALFNDEGSFFSKNVIRTSKQIESYETKLDSFEGFLIHIDEIAIDEAGGLIILKSSANKSPMKFMKRYEKGLDQYLEILAEMRRALENI
tara:strand:+ start:2546 stop:3418 length:873 start_codon:yes stop_codon:yes gene_type:complete